MRNKDRKCERCGMTKKEVDAEIHLAKKMGGWYFLRHKLEKMNSKELEQTGIALIRASKNKRLEEYVEQKLQKPTTRKAA